MEYLTTGMPTTWLTTSNRGYSVYALEELKRLFPSLEHKPLESAVIHRVEIDEPYSAVTDLLSAHEPVFLRHIHPVQMKCAIDAGRYPIQNARLIVEQLLEQVPSELNCGIHNFLHRCKVAVQIRKQESIAPVYKPAELKQAVDAVLVYVHECEPVVRGADWILSLYIAGAEVYAGISRPHHNLSDWSGGAVRYAREENQVSRAKFKLLEAEYKFNLDLSQYRRSLDLGASPGGWTSLLLERGLQVTAVDPAPLHPDLVNHPMLTFLQKTADQASFPSGHFDLIVCDMSWSPRQMVKLFSDLLYALKEGGDAIITLKLMHGKPLAQLKRTTVALEPGLRLIRAKQLFHNRQELTLYLRKEGRSTS